MSPEQQAKFINQLRECESVIQKSGVPIVDYMPFYNYTKDGIAYIIYYLPAIDSLRT